MPPLLAREGFQSEEDNSKRYQSGKEIFERWSNINRTPEWEPPPSHNFEVLITGKDKNNFVELPNGETLILPRIFKDLADQIEKSKYILGLGDDWDENGAVGYTKETFIQAIQFLTNYALWSFNEHGRIVDTPDILPGADGTIDLLWEKMDYDLLLTISVYPKSTGQFYGDDKNATKISGEFPLEDFSQVILLCLLAQN